MKYTKEQLRTGAEKAFILTLLRNNPTGIISHVSDSFDLFSIITKVLPSIKEEILSRDGKLVIRPDSGDPVDIICGKKFRSFQSFTEAEDFYKKGLENDNRFTVNGKLYGVVIHRGEDFQYSEQGFTPELKGVIELLWDIFGGTVNEQGYKVLDSHIGAIYGDSITPERAIQIAERLKAKGFANQIVLGIGSYSLGYATRDSQGGAVKSTAVVVNGELREIFKDPATDNGTKKSAKGLLKVNEDLTLTDCCTFEEEKTGLLETIYTNGKFVKTTTLTKIRNKINGTQS